MTSEMATEKRLIDANALGICKAKREAFENPAYADGWNSAIEIIENAPTVDAVPVVHGKWELRNVTSGMNGRYWCCSACGCIRSYWEYKAEDNYCFKCGAKMDGERRTDNG
jgi:hypothetical protein